MIIKGIFYLLNREMFAKIKLDNTLYFPPFFFLLLLFLFPFCFGSFKTILSITGFSFVAIALLLTSFLTFKNLFEAEIEEGSLELYLFSKFPLEGLMLFKNIIHWILYKGLLFFIIPFIYILYNVPLFYLFLDIPLLIIFSITITFFGSIFTILSQNISNKQFAVIFLLIPLIIPIVIFTIELHNEFTNFIIDQEKVYFWTILSFLYAKKLVKLILVFSILVFGLSPWINSFILSLYYL